MGVPGGIKGPHSQHCFGEQVPAMYVGLRPEPGHAAKGVLAKCWRRPSQVPALPLHTPEGQRCLVGQTPLVVVTAAASASRHQARARPLAHFVPSP